MLASALASAVAGRIPPQLAQMRDDLRDRSHDGDVADDHAAATVRPKLIGRSAQRRPGTRDQRDSEARAALRTCGATAAGVALGLDVCETTARAILAGDKPLKVGDLAALTAAQFDVMVENVRGRWFGEPLAIPRSAADEALLDLTVSAIKAKDPAEWDRRILLVQAHCARVRRGAK